MPCVYSEKEAFWILFSPLLWFVWSAFPLSTRWLSTGSFRFAEDWYGWLVSLKQLSLKQQSQEASKDHFCSVRCGFYKKIARLSLTNFAECALLKRFSPKRQNSYSLELRLARILEIQFGSDCWENIMKGLWNLWDSSGSPCRLRQIVVLRPCFLLNALKLALNPWCSASRPCFQWNRSSKMLTKWIFGKNDVQDKNYFLEQTASFFPLLFTMNDNIFAT